MREVEVVVVGAGQAGLSAAYFLSHRGVSHDEFAVLDSNDGPGGAWRHRWPTLTMEKVHGVHSLPGLDLPDHRPTALACDVVPTYFADYEQRFALPVARPVQVERVEDRDDHRLEVTTDVGRWRTRGLINATGTWTRPFWPLYPGADRFAGRQLHTADYQGPDEFAGQRVVVVGGGHSAIQHIEELLEVATVTWVTRRPPVWREGSFDEQSRREAVASVERAVAEGRRPESVVSVTGLIAPPVVAAALEDGSLPQLAMFDHITTGGVAWDDERVVEADVILMATGFRHALDHLAPLGLRGGKGGIVMDGTQVAADPRIHLLGYGPSASTIGANRAARVAVRDLRRWLETHPHGRTG